MYPNHSGTLRVRVPKQISPRSLSCIIQYSKDQEISTVGAIDPSTDGNDTGDKSQPVGPAPGILSSVDQDHGGGIGSVSLKTIERQLDQLTKDVISRRSASSKRMGPGEVVAPSTVAQSSGPRGGREPPPGPCRIRNITWDTIGSRIGGHGRNPAGIGVEAAIVPDDTRGDSMFPRGSGGSPDSAASDVGNETVVERDDPNQNNGSAVGSVLERTGTSSSPTFITGAHDGNRNTGMTGVGSHNIVGAPQTLDPTDTSTTVAIPRSGIISTDSPPSLPLSPCLDRRNDRPQGIDVSLPESVDAATSASELGRQGFHVGEEQAGVGEAAAALAERDKRNMLWAPHRDEMRALFRAVVGKSGGNRKGKGCRASLLRAQPYEEDVVERQRRYDLNDRFLRVLLQRKFECERLPFLFAARSRSRLHGYSVNDAYEMAKKQAARMPPLI